MAGTLPPARPATDKDRDNILIPVASGVQELLFAPVNPFNDRPGFIAGPTPETGLAAAVQGITRLNCRLWASRDKSGYSPRVNQYNGEVCGPYLDDLGENPDDGAVELPFEGGQCAGVSYRLTWTETQFFSDCTTLVGNPDVGGFIGPIGAVSYSGNPSCPTAPGTTATISTGGGPVLLGGAGGGVRISGISVTREDLGADNCGNPDPTVQPPATVTPVTPIVPTFNINLPGVGPINISVDLDGDGQPVICAPDLDVCIEVNPEFGVGIGGEGDGDGGGGDGGLPPGDIGSPGTGDTAGGVGGDAEGEAPPGSVLVGLDCDLTVIPENSRQYTPGVYRGVCYIYMGVPGNLDHDPAGAMMTSSQFVFAEKDNLTSWRVSANNGFIIGVTPYYREVEE